MQPDITAPPEWAVASTPVSRVRRQYYTELGGFIAGLRPKKWNSSYAALRAHDRKLPLSRNVIERLEAGKIENPKPEVLQAVADLYGAKYEEIVWAYVRERYGVTSDQSRHSTIQGSALHQEATDDPASDERRESRIRELESRVRELEAVQARYRLMQDVARSLTKLLAREKSIQARAAAAGRGRAHRKPD
jgi:transcriptional regulator with XRE-family HTH domain